MKTTLHPDYLGNLILLQMYSTMKKSIIIFFTLLSCVCSLHSQNRIIQGKIIDSDFETLIGIEILLNDSVCIGKTDRDGCFQVEIPSSINKLTFFYVSYERADLQLDDGCNVIELIMIERPFYDFMSFRKIDRYRRKLYKKLPKLHKEAYEKGIFQTPEACYVQEFHKLEDEYSRPLPPISIEEDTHK